MTDAVINAVFEVSNTLGAGFLEKVYEKALVRELTLRGIKAEAQVPLPVEYKGATIGQYYVDILVEDQLILELKCVEHFAPEHIAQALNYLKASGRNLCLLINFQHPRVQIKRVFISVNQRESAAI